jgi:truncated hemoglobin YjbI
VVEAAFIEPRAGVVLFLAGPPGMVYEARYQAVLAGVSREDTRADPFEDVRSYMPDDKGKLGRIAPDPELWRALDEGPGLTVILNDFYELAFRDARLSPFFHLITKTRAIEKQYEFLSEVFTGNRHYLGARPFNAHHWMIISDELFDYRERIIVGAMRRYGLTEALIRRWSGVHELFRREIVKTHQRGMVVDGVEIIEQGYNEEILPIDAVCDGCDQVIPAGVTSRHHLPTGKLYCAGCGAVSVKR